jgi:hypothetical protein
MGLPNQRRTMLAVPDSLPHLSSGAHRSGSGDLCAMEAASWLSGRDQTDHPECVDTDLAAFLRGANDRLPNEPRQRLWSYIYRSLDTRIDNWEMTKPAMYWRHRAQTLSLEMTDMLLRMPMHLSYGETHAMIFDFLDRVFDEYETITNRKTSTVPQRSNLIHANCA